MTVYKVYYSINSHSELSDFDDEMGYIPPYYEKVVEANSMSEAEMKFNEDSYGQNYEIAYVKEEQ